MDETSGKFEYITGLPEPQIKLNTIPDEKQNKDQKDFLNKMISENKTKTKKLKDLSRLIQEYEKQASDKVFHNENTEIISELQLKLQEKEEKIDQEIQTTSILLNKKENLKILTVKMKGKLIELQKNFDRITTNHSNFYNSQFLSKYTLLLSNKALDDYKQYFENSKALFKQNLVKLESKRRSAADLNSLITKKTLAIDNEKTKKTKKEFLNYFENCLKSFSDITTNRKISQQRLETYKSKFQIICNFINSEDNSDEIIKSHPIEDFQIQKIIQKLKSLEYRAESLNFAYEKLSEQEIRASNELTKTKAELLKVKKKIEENNKNFDPDSQIVQKTNSADLEYLIIKIYYVFAEILAETIEKISISNIKVEKDLEAKFLSALKTIKEVKTGVLKRKTVVMSKTIDKTGKNNEIKIDTINSIALTGKELKEIFFSVFPDELSTQFIEIIETTPVIKTFLDKETLKNYLTGACDKITNEFILNLIYKCHLIYQDKFKSFTCESLYFLLSLRKFNEENRNFDKPGIAEVFLRPLDCRVRKTRSLCTSPLKIVDNSTKPNSKLMESASAIENIKIKTHKKLPKVFMVTNTALKEQKVMKEVLQNQKKESLLRTIEKNISKTSEKYCFVPFTHKFALGSTSQLKKLTYSSSSSRGELTKKVWY